MLYGCYGIIRRIIRSTRIIARHGLTLWSLILMHIHNVFTAYGFQVKYCIRMYIPTILHNIHIQMRFDLHNRYIQIYNIYIYIYW